MFGPEFQNDAKKAFFFIIAVALGIGLLIGWLFH